MQQIKDCDKLSALAYPKPLPNLDAITSDSNVRDYLNELQNTGCKLTCLCVFINYLFVIHYFLQGKSMYSS